MKIFIAKQLLKDLAKTSCWKFRIFPLLNGKLFFFQKFLRESCGAVLNNFFISFKCLNYWNFHFIQCRPKNFHMFSVCRFHNFHDKPFSLIGNFNLYHSFSCSFLIMPIIYIFLFISDYGTKTCGGYPGSIDHIQQDMNVSKKEPLYFVITILIKFFSHMTSGISIQSKPRGKVMIF